MEAAVKQAPSYSAKEMNIKQKKTIALQVYKIHQKQTITNIAKENQVSRQFVYKQKNKATQAIDDVFKEPEIADEKKNEKVLFYLPVTKSWLIQLVLGLLLHCRCSFRGVTKLFQDVLDSSIYVSTVHNISTSAIQKARGINEVQDLSRVKLCAPDEATRPRLRRPARRSS